MNPNAKWDALAATIADFRPLEVWASEKIEALRKSLESTDATNVAAIAKLQGQIEALRGVQSLKATVDNMTDQNKS